MISRNLHMDSLQTIDLMLNRKAATVSGLHGGNPQRSRRLGASSTQLNLLRWYFIFVALLTAKYAYLTAHTLNGWSIEDWLINYQAGFVRRGAVGAIVYELHKVLGIRLVPIALLAQVSCYGVVLYTVYFLLRRQPGWSLWTWALLVSPATFSFQIAGPLGGFRKEILFFSGLSAVLIFLRMNVADWKIAGFLAAWLPFTILCHEMLFAYLAYYPAALILSGRSYSRVVRMTLLPFILSAIAMFAVLTHHGDQAKAVRICSSFKEVEPAPCGPAIAALGQSSADARAFTYANTHWLRCKLIWCLTGSLAGAPIVVFVWRAFATARTFLQARVLSITIVVSLFISLPTYFYAADWGRWIYIQMLSVSLLILFMDWDHVLVDLPLGHILKGGRFASRAAALALLFAYATCWTLPHFPGVPRGGIMENVFHLGERSHYLRNRL